MKDTIKNLVFTNINVVSKWNTKVVVVFATALALSACSAPDSEKVAEAQACLDKATADTALSCIEKISSLDSSAANYMKCAAYFTFEGFSDPAQLSNAISALQGGNNTGVMSVLAFQKRGTGASDVTAQTANAQDAIAAFNYCNKGKSKGMILLATYAQTATIAKKVSASLGAGCQTDMAASLSCLKNNAGSSTPEEKQAIGNAVVATYQSSCTNGQNVSASLCSQAAAAIQSGGGDPATIAQQFLNNY